MALFNPTTTRSSSSSSSSLLLLRRPLSTSPAPLSPAESHLLDKLHSLLKHHHLHHPLPLPSPPPPSLLLPSLTPSFSLLFPHPPSPSLTHHLILRFSSLRRNIPFPQLLSFFNFSLSHSPSPSSLSPSFTSLIHLSAKLHHFHLAHHLLDSMLSLSLPIPLPALSSLIRRYIRAARFSDAISTFHRLPHYGLDPDPLSFSLLLSSLSRHRQAPLAQSLFDSFCHKFQPDVVLYSTLVHAWCRAGSIETAEKIFVSMRDAGVNPNVYTYTIVIDAMCRAGQMVRAQEVLCQMIEAGVPPNTATFNCFMRANVRAGRSEQVLQVHNQMRRIGCEPDRISHNFVIEAHCGKGRRNLEAGIRVLNLMILKGKECGGDCGPDASSFNHLLKCVLGMGDVGAALMLYERMREVGCRPSVVTYNLLIRIFSKDKSLDMVLRMKREMEKEGVEPNVNTYVELIMAFCERGSWKRCYQLMKEMVEEEGLKPTKQVYEKVQELLRRAGQLKKHDELVGMMAERGFVSRPPLDC